MFGVVVIKILAIFTKSLVKTKAEVVDVYITEPPEPPVSLLVFTLRQMYTSKQTHKHPPFSPLTS